MTGLAHDVLIVETAMPVVTQTVVAAAEYGADEEFAAQGAAPVSYTHLDVYKRQFLFHARNRRQHNFAVFRLSRRVHRQHADRKQSQHLSLIHI